MTTVNVQAYKSTVLINLKTTVAFWIVDPSGVVWVSYRPPGSTTDPSDSTATWAVYAISGAAVAAFLATLTSIGTIADPITSQNGSGGSSGSGGTGSGGSGSGSGSNQPAAPTGNANYDALYANLNHYWVPE